VALDGTGYCWGNNDSGQLGDGTTTSAATPTPIAGNLLFSSLSAGTWHSCGVTTGGLAYCWGYYSPYGYPTGGELGDGTTVPSLVPVKVAGQP
jgi:alpha-tubulin suppressor-like RCC1 family protein